jgi:hypothetical protein
MSKYKWARSFIRLARLFAVLIVLLGAAALAFSFWKLKSDLSIKSYHPNPDLSVSMSEAAEALGKSENIISTFQHKTGGGPVPDSLFYKMEVLQSYNSSDQLDAAHGQLDNAAQNTAALKAFLVSIIENNINDLVQQLKEHANEISPPHPETGEPTPAPASPTAVLAHAAEDLRGLYSERVTSDEAAQRKSLLEKVQDSLNVLAQRTVKPDNLAKLQKSISELQRIEGLLDYLTLESSLPPPPNPPDVNSPAAGGDQAAVASTDQPDEVTALKVSEHLEECESIIESAINGDWLVDEKISQAQQLVDQEEKAVVSAANDVAELYFGFIEDCIAIALSVFLLAYLILILADLLQAHLDTADNSFTKQIE